MKTADAILAIDQGTTSSRAILFSPEADILGVSQQEFEQIFPADGWVEHRPADLWETVVGLYVRWSQRLIALAVSHYYWHYQSARNSPGLGQAVGRGYL